MLRVACPKPDLQYAKQLQSLLDRAFLLLGRKTIDDALPAIMAFEEQKRQEEERKRRED